MAGLEVDEPQGSNAIACFTSDVFLWFTNQVVCFRGLCAPEAIAPAKFFNLPCKICTCSNIVSRLKAYSEVVKDLARQGRLIALAMSVKGVKRSDIPFERYMMEVFGNTSSIRDRYRLHSDALGADLGDILKRLIIVLGHICDKSSISHSAVTFDVMVLVNDSAMDVLKDGERRSIGARKEPLKCPKVHAVPIAPTTWEPNHSSIKLAIFPSLYAFLGKVVISFKFVSAAKFVKLNGDEIRIRRASITLEPPGRLGCTKKSNLHTTFGEGSRNVVIDLAENVQVGTSAKLSLWFTGKINDRGEGLHRIVYSCQGQEKIAIVSNFNKGYARFAFPCWDELTFRSSYEFVVDIPENYTVISNMTVISAASFQKAVNVVPIGNGFKSVQFAHTPKLPTCALGLIAMEANYVERIGPGGMIFRFYGMPSSYKRNTAALDIIVKIYAVLEEYFAYRIGLEKLDYVSVPDFNECASEFYGLILACENYLVAENSEDGRTEREVHVSIAHELTRLWLGAVVSPQSWNEFFIHDALCTYVGDKLANIHCPSREFEVFTALCDTNKGLIMDASRHSKIETIRNPIDIDIYRTVNLFAKPYHMLVLLERFLGDELFRNALRSFIYEYAYKSISLSQIWRWMSSLSGYDVELIVSEWMSKPGFPLLCAEIDWSKPTAVLRLKQTRFIEDGTNGQKEFCWAIIVMYSYKNAKAPLFHLMTKQEDEIVLSNFNRGDWLKLNWDFKGFYRVFYGIELRRALFKSFQCFGDTNRMSILADAVKVIAYLELLEACAEETCPGMLSLMATSAVELMGTFQFAPMYKRLRRFFRKLLYPMFHTYGWKPKESRSYLEKVARFSLLSALVECGDEIVVQFSREMFDAFVKYQVPIISQLRPLILCAVCRYGDEADADTMLRLYKENVDEPNSSEYLAAIGYTPILSVLENLLKFYEAGNLASKSHIASIFEYMPRTVVGHKFAWCYIKAHWKELVQTHGNTLYFDKLVKQALTNVHGEMIDWNVDDAFASPDDVEPYLRPLLRSIQVRSRINTQVLAQHVEVGQWLQGRGFKGR
ncbi:LOC733291 protein [Trichuris trichiura]|uniref:LOC733291 protein n=1 Tax=Trichuris trichiura TaxID=36087 RepID=A0A077ZA07_TRITR|nr:LOC733291 protein [Trichuris trichiura]